MPSGSIRSGRVLAGNRELDGPVPIILSGWRVVADPRNYYGSLVRGSDVVTSDSSGQQGSAIWM